MSHGDCVTTIGFRKVSHGDCVTTIGLRKVSHGDNGVDDHHGTLLLVR